MTAGVRGAGEWNCFQKGEDSMASSLHACPTEMSKICARCIGIRFKLEKKSPKNQLIPPSTLTIYLDFTKDLSLSLNT